MERLLEIATNRHDFAHRLHLRRQTIVGLREFLEGKTRYLGHHVVNAGFERGRSRPAGYIVLQFIEGVAHRQFGGNLGDWETGGLGGQRRGA